MSSTKLNRREFLKLASLLPLAYYTPPSRFNIDNLPNILVIVFDAFSAKHIPFHGYERNTIPNISKLIDRATVYHNHFSGGIFTSPGTASLLTGTYPWTHRAVRLKGEVIEHLKNRNLFSSFDQYYRISYTHNAWVSLLQDQFSQHIEHIKTLEDLFFGRNKWFYHVFSNDKDIAEVSWLEMIAQTLDKSSNSLLLAPFFELFRTPPSENFPRGYPGYGAKLYYLLEDAINWTISVFQESPKPFLGYIHYLPPHAPYHTRADFIDAFKDDSFKPINKPELFAKYFDKRSNYTSSQLYDNRQYYDEFILYLDSEFNRLFIELEKTGLLDNTWIIFTSDHGEMFERSTIGHSTPMIYSPVINIPLIIFEPGQQTRKDIYTPTSAVDILPTLLQITGGQPPSWGEGEVLPPYWQSPVNTDRSIFAIESRDSQPGSPLNPYTAMIVKDQYKLTYYDGYKQMKGKKSTYELYNFIKDPEELEDLSKSHNSTAKEMLNELRETIARADEPYLKK